MVIYKWCNNYQSKKRTCKRNLRVLVKKTSTADWTAFINAILRERCSDQPLANVIIGGTLFQSQSNLLTMPQIHSAGASLGSLQDGCKMSFKSHKFRWFSVPSTNNPPEDGCIAPIENLSGCKCTRCTRTNEAPALDWKLHLVNFINNALKKRLVVTYLK